jgi:O-antigen ligase/tetratricopeptide (TPR) repeat protein
MNTKYLETVLRWIVIGGIFLLPFVPTLVASSMFFPYITGKNFAFRILVEIMTGAWLALALVDARYRPKRSWILGAFGVFVVLIAIADAHGVYPFKSFWSNFERMDGWITLIHTFLYMTVAAAMMHTENLWKRLFQLSLAVSVFLSAYGALQVLGIVALGQGTGSGLSVRIDATFGNSIYLAIYMLFHVFIAALLLAQDTIQKRADALRIAFYGSIMALDTVALFLTGTRGTMLGLIIGTIVAALLMLFMGNQSRRARHGAVWTLVIVLVLGGGLYLARDTQTVHNIGFLQRLSTISVHDTTIQARFLNIETAWKGVKERPFLGWGQENYAVVFDKYYDPRMYADEPWFDRVHNIFFDWLIAGGILGLLAYLSIFVATAYVIWRKRANAIRPLHVIEKSILSGLFVGYFVHNVAVFDNVTSYILWATMLAYIMWRTQLESDVHVPQKTPFNRDAVSVTATVMLIITVLVLWWANWLPYEQNVGLLRVLTQQQPSAAMLQAQMDNVIAVGAFGTQEAREQLSQVANSVASAAGVPAKDRQLFFEDTMKQLSLQSQASPMDARFPLFMGSVSASFGDLLTAESSLEHAHQLSPHKQTIIFQQAAIEMALNKPEVALADYKEAYDLAPAYNQARILYAIALIKAKDETTADALLAPLATSSAIINPDIAAAYIAQNHYSKIVSLWGMYIQANPTDPEAHLTVAGQYYKLGKKDDAIATLNDLVAHVPSLASQIGTIITEIKNGSAPLQ